MTFSDQPIIDLVTKEFEAVWETVAPVTEATFDLGNGREVRGTVGGEIAIYFCRPDGKVFDILPALQSPAATRQAIENALAFYRQTDARLFDVRAHHQSKLYEERTTIGEAGSRGWFEVTPDSHLWTLVKEGMPTDDLSNLSPEFEQEPLMPHKDKLEQHRNSADSGTRLLGEMAFSKTMVVDPEPILVVEPGGLNYYRHQIRGRFVLNKELRAPDEWKRFVFEEVLDQKLTGEKLRFDSSTPTPMSIIE